jgi:hypothetical protein
MTPVCSLSIPAPFADALTGPALLNRRIGGSYRYMWRHGGTGIDLGSGGCIVARPAPGRPMRHAWVSGVAGLAAAVMPWARAGGKRRGIQSRAGPRRKAGIAVRAWQA